MRYIITLMLLTNTLLVYSQTSSDTISDNLEQYFEFLETPNMEFLLSYYPPLTIINSKKLKAFIRSSTFTRIREQKGDLLSIDAIFIRSMQLSKNNTAIALLLSTIATIDRRTITLKVPFFKLVFPLSNESEEELQGRISNLPRQFFREKPKVDDRDKLQHFFASAFITFILESSSIVDKIGLLVEEGEAFLLHDGAFDVRDTCANLLGQQFGLALIENNYLKPSQFLTNSHCVGEQR